MSNNDVTPTIEIDDNKVKRIMRKIFIAEQNFIRSNEKSDTKMVQEIKKIIEKEVKCL